MTGMRRTSMQSAYDLAASVGAKRVVQVGGVPSLSVALARAVRASTGGRGGLVVSTDLEDFAVKRSKVELERAGVEEYVHFFEGDPRCTLQDLEGPFDLLWLDCTPEMAADVLAILGERLREGAIVAGSVGTNSRVA